MSGLTADLLLRAYAVGIFPMAERADSTEIYWFDPRERGILPLDGFHLPKRLKRTVRKTSFKITINQDFSGVIDGCAAPRPDRPNTWINEEVREAYMNLHHAGSGHSVECWDDHDLVGGLYGVSLGGAFFGESMFSTARDASKIALVHLVARLRYTGFSLLDTQFVTDHLRQFGAREIPREIYRQQLSQAVKTPAAFDKATEEEIMQAFWDHHQNPAE